MCKNEIFTLDKIHVYTNTKYLLSYFHTEKCTTGGIMFDDCPG